jgi:hypothetical protein
MIRNTSGPGPAGNTQRTRFPAILSLLLLCFLAFSGKNATAITWQAQGPSPMYNGDAAIVAPPDNQISDSGGLPTGSVTSLASDPTKANRLYAAVQNSGIFRSDDQGKTWTNITPANSGIGANTSYIHLSVGAGGPSLFMGLTNNSSKDSPPNTLQAVWRSLDLTSKRLATWPGYPPW